MREEDKTKVYELDVERVGLGDLVIMDKSVEEDPHSGGITLLDDFYRNAAVPVEIERGKYCELVSCDWNELRMLIRQYTDEAQYFTEEISEQCLCPPSQSLPVHANGS